MKQRKCLLLQHVFFSPFVFLLGDGNFWSLRWTSAQPVLVEAFASSRLKVVQPFYPLHCGPALFWGEKRYFCHIWVSKELHWGIGRIPVSANFTPRLLPPAAHPVSPRGREQQPPWCCRKDKETNCECCVSMLLHCICKQDETRHAHKHVRFYTGLCFCVCMHVSFWK